MRIAAVRLVPYRLPLKRPWIAASATLTARQGALVRVTTQDGLDGWGDCAPLPSSGAAGHGRVLAALADRARRLADADIDTASVDGPPEVCWAIETALLDIAAQRRGVSLARLLGAGTPATDGATAATTIAVNAALGLLDAACAGRATEAVAQGFAIGKIKVGIDAVDTELARLHALVDATQGRLRLRLDANRAWPETAARRFLAAVVGLPIEAVEEPLAAPTIAGLAELQAALPFVVAVDESLLALGVDALAGAKAVRRFVIKPARIGGHQATRAIAQKAARAGIEVVLTSVVDSAIGVTAAAHLAAAVAPALAHGLGTSAWLAADVAAAPAIADGRMTLPTAPGLGVSARPGLAERLP